MNIFTAIKNFILGAPKVADNVFDKDNGLLVKAGGFINDLNYTEAERAENTLGFAKSVIEYVKTTLTESTDRSLTRRAIAILWIKVQLGLVLLTAIAIPINTEWAKAYFELATCNIMLWGTGSVIIFFFGAYAWGAHIKKNGPEKK